MSSWLASLESVVRLYNAAVFLTVLFALTAAASGVASYWLSKRVASLRSEAAAREVTAVREEVSEQAAAQRSELEESRKALEAAEARAGEFLDRIESLEEQLAQRSSKPAATPAPTRPRPAAPAAASSSAAEAVFTKQRRDRLLGALEGRATGAITLVAVSGDRRSSAAARDLSSILTGAGWTPEVIEAYFPSRPNGLVFVVHARDSIPERQYVLAQALSEAGMLNLPAKMIVNPARPEGFLGLLVVTQSQ